MIRSTSIPLPNSYRLPETNIFAGEHPLGIDPEQPAEKLRGFLECRIDHFLDLTEEHEDWLHPYVRAIEPGVAESGRDLLYQRLSIRDMGIPSAERMHEILDAIDAAQAAGRRSYIHCWGGIGRTGTVVGCFLVRHGPQGDEALRTVSELFHTMSPPKVQRHSGHGSPQTHSQRDFVRNWAEVAP